MKETLTAMAMNMVLIIHVMALLVVAFGTAQAFIRSIRAMLSPSATGKHFHAAYIQYARWLVGGLTFQLAADIAESAFSPSWDEIGRLAAIAVIRTFVNYFLERDLAEVEKREAKEQGTAVYSPRDDRS
jgi:uncharacterized membrane protein